VLLRAQYVRFSKKGKGSEANRKETKDQRLMSGKSARSRFSQKRKDVRFTNRRAMRNSLACLKNVL
jgi:hypothetical protein